MAFRIWIDNDACPKRVRDIVFKAGKRCHIPITIVANRYMHPPADFDCEVVVVGSQFDAADSHIAEQVKSGDLVITADVPLCDRIIKNGAVALSPRGQLYDHESIQELLALRNLRQELRSAGEIQGGPAKLDNLDIGKFASAFDRLITRMLKQENVKKG